MLPETLTQNALFCCWKRETRNGQPTKIPYDPKTGERAKANDPGTFSDYDEAVWKSKALSCNGVGIYIGLGFSAIDIDHCFDDGKLTELAADIIATMDSYTEYSPSGNGIRILFRTDLAYDREKYYIKNPKNGVEVYVEGATQRFVTVTGDTLEVSPEDIYERTEQLRTVLDKYMLRPVKTKSGKRRAPAEKRYTLTDDQIIDKACHEERFDALFRSGDMTYYNNDQSSADLALCNKLAFWCGCDKVQMDRIFRRSALMRDKWDSPRESSTYGDITLQRAIDDCDTVYEATVYDRNVFDRLDVPYLETEEWELTLGGVSRSEPPARGRGDFKRITAATTPVAPAMLLENLDTGTQKTELHFIGRDGKQRSLIVDNEVISHRNKIVALSNLGIGVTSTTATALVDYLQAVVRRNQAVLPFCSAVSRLGWVGDKFVPYDQDVKFDGEAADRKLFRSVTSSGTLSDWCGFIQPLRVSIPLRLIMAASFASPLIQRCGALPFIFHLWGKTGAGKTVALKVAMSVWGRPCLGELLYTMNMTDNAMMNTAGFLYSLPFAGDELQLVKNNLGYDRLIMRVTEGVDRGRMKYDAKLAQKTWRNAFLFTGEEPCTSDSSGGGAKNRVIEVCVNGIAVVPDGGKVASFTDSNYGCAGPVFIDYVRAHDPKPYYDSYFHTLLHSCDVTDKQAMAAAMLLTGDELARQCLFPGEPPLTVEDIEPWIKSDAEVDTAIRAKEYILEWLEVNRSFFEDGQKQRYGKLDGSFVYVINSVLKDALKDRGFDFDAVKLDWATEGFLAKGNDGKYTVKARLTGSPVRCVKLHIA